MKKLLLTLILLQTILSAQVSNLKEVKLQLQWKYQFQFAGFIMAKELGYYKDIGLDVKILEYTNTQSLQQLQNREVDYITELDEWVMQEALAQFERWRDLGLNPGVLSLNLAVPRLEKEDFIQSVQEIFSSTKTQPASISFEVTESQIMRNPEKSIEKLNQLSELGIKLSIDDFRTGYSSLSYLKKLPINRLKIDQSFIKDIPHDSDDIEITKTIISMAKNLKLNIIAEGVETQEQSDFLSQHGCNEIQGYLYHKPAPADEVEQLLKDKLL